MRYKIRGTTEFWVFSPRSSDDAFKMSASIKNFTLQKENRLFDNANLGSFLLRDAL